MIYMDRTKITKIGNSKYVRVCEAALVNMGIKDSTELDLEYDPKANRLIITKTEVSPAPDAQADREVG